MRRVPPLSILAFLFTLAACDGGGKQPGPPGGGAPAMPVEASRILVRSGDRVRPGTPLLLIDAGMQQAARMKTLLEAGAASTAEMEQAQTAA